MAQPQLRWLSDDAVVLNTRAWANTSRTESRSQRAVKSQEHGDKAKALEYKWTFTAPEARNATKKTPPERDSLLFGKPS